MHAGEIVEVTRVESVAMIGDDIGGACGERDRAREVDLLPTAGGFICKDGSGKQRACGVPKMASVRSCVLRSLVKTDRRDLTGS